MSRVGSSNNVKIFKPKSSSSYGYMKNVVYKEVLVDLPKNQSQNDESDLPKKHSSSGLEKIFSKKNDVPKNPYSKSRQKSPSSGRTSRSSSNLSNRTSSGRSSTSRSRSRTSSGRSSTSRSRSRTSSGRSSTSRSRSRTSSSRISGNSSRTSSSRRSRISSRTSKTSTNYHFNNFHSRSRTSSRSSNISSLIDNLGNIEMDSRYEGQGICYT